MAEPRPVANITTMLKLDGKGMSAPATMRMTLPLGTMADAETTRDIPRATGPMTKRGVQAVFGRLTVTKESREVARTRIAVPEPR